MRAGRPSEFRAQLGSEARPKFAYFHHLPSAALISAALVGLPAEEREAKSHFGRRETKTFSGREMDEQRASVMSGRR